MRITNEFNLPKALVNIANKNNQPHNKENCFSATTLLKGVKEIVLDIRHFDEITMDVSDMVWTIFGTAVHEIAEKGHDGEDGESEIAFEYVLPIKSKLGKTYKLTGRCDLYNENKFLLEDYKTATTWKFIYKDFEDWEKQGYTYTFLIRKSGKYVNKINFHALLKDWSQGDLEKAKKKGEYYPEHSIVTYSFVPEESKLHDIELAILEKAQKIVDIIENEIPDDEIEICNENERWATKPMWAVMKEGRVTALKLCESEKQAKEYIDMQFKDKNKMYIQYRPGEDKKCMRYCPCCEFCNYYKEKYGKKEGEK